MFLLAQISKIAYRLEKKTCKTEPSNIQYTLAAGTGHNHRLPKMTINSYTGNT